MYETVHGFQWWLTKNINPFFSVAFQYLKKGDVWKILIIQLLFLFRHRRLSHCCERKWRNSFCWSKAADQLDAGFFSSKGLPFGCRIFGHAKKSFWNLSQCTALFSPKERFTFERKKLFHLSLKKHKTFSEDVKYQAVYNVWSNIFSDVLGFIHPSRKKQPLN